ncbi:hypothetical protein THAOC_31738 [Thalassiosira oceanica]|uniref:Uncharacterized protein n=1 Tax=Thalassiosira oceanica TaxID=159749 RepID=K0R8M2_THAOC|nr:hypothetical protein THAOC_31738 [Thalassiosira oceanica]|eukprot:EJK49395.1 hypothetical protein THAOC_31738 [Thalassiosira oceanica]
MCWAPQQHLGGSTSVGWPPVRVRICKEIDSSSSSLFRRSGRADGARQCPTGCCSCAANTPRERSSDGRWVEHTENLTILGLQPTSPLGDPPFRNYSAKSANFGSFLYLALLLTTKSYFEGMGEVLQYARDAVTRGETTHPRTVADWRDFVIFRLVKVNILIESTGYCYREVGLMVFDCRNPSLFHWSATALIYRAFNMSHKKLKLDFCRVTDSEPN